MKVIVDAGHGGKDSGALGVSGTMEKTIALKVARLVRSHLTQADVSAGMTRSGDDFVTLSGRAELANKWGAALLSIHCNAGGGKGFECFTTPGETKSDAWADAVMRSYAAAFPDRAMRADISDGDLDKEARFTVLTKTRGPAILFELGFIDTVAGEAFLNDDENQKRMALAIARGTLEWLGLDLPSLEVGGPSLSGDLLECAEAVRDELIVAITEAKNLK